MLVNNAVIPEAKQATEFFSAPEDGPFVMVNLLKFKANAEYADGSDADLTGRQAYDRYAEGVGKLVEALGGSFEFSGEVTGILLGEVEELWDLIAMVEYPSYASVAPISWVVEAHVAEGREKVNYSEFDQRQRGADETIEVIQEGSMPPAYYTRFGRHPEAKLTSAELQELIDGLRATPGLSED